MSQSNEIILKETLSSKLLTDSLKNDYAGFPAFQEVIEYPNRVQFTFYTASFLVLAFLIIGTQEAFSIFIPYPEPSKTPVIILGEKTEELLSSLSQMNMNAKVIGKIKRQPTFSVEGVVVTLDDDNIQIFEYSDEATATKEGLALTAQYKKPRWEYAWAPPIRLYQKNTLLVYYLGDHEDIANTLYDTLQSPNVTTMER